MDNLINVILSKDNNQIQNIINNQENINIMQHKCNLNKLNGVRSIYSDPNMTIVYININNMNKNEDPNNFIQIMNNTIKVYYSSYNESMEIIIIQYNLQQTISEETLHNIYYTFVDNYNLIMNIVNNLQINK